MLCKKRNTYSFIISIFPAQCLNCKFRLDNKHQFKNNEKRYFNSMPAILAHLSRFGYFLVHNESSAPYCLRFATIATKDESTFLKQGRCSKLMITMDISSNKLVFNDFPNKIIIFITYSLNALRNYLSPIETTLNFQPPVSSLRQLLTRKDMISTRGD